MSPYYTFNPTNPFPHPEPIPIPRWPFHTLSK